MSDSKTNDDLSEIKGNNSQTYAVDASDISDVDSPTEVKAPRSSEDSGNLIVDSPTEIKSLKRRARTGSRVVPKQPKKKRQKEKADTNAGKGVRARFTVILFLLMLLPAVLIAILAWYQMVFSENPLERHAISIATDAIDDVTSAHIEDIAAERAAELSRFLYQRDQDILMLSELIPSEDSFRLFSENRNSHLIMSGDWVISEDGLSWEQLREDEFFEDNFKLFSLYDEITFIDLYGQELIKYVSSNSSKVHFPLGDEKSNISLRHNTYVRSESYWENLLELSPGEIFVSEVVGVYTETLFTGMFTPGVLGEIDDGHVNFEQLTEIADLPENEFIEVARQQSFAGAENPVGRRFEGIIRWATPVTDFENEIIGFVTMALNFDHILHFFEHIEPMQRRSVIAVYPGDGSTIMLWDNENRIISSPRHQYIFGFNPLTGYVTDAQTEPAEEWSEIIAEGEVGSLFTNFGGVDVLAGVSTVAYYSGRFSPSVQDSRVGFGYVTVIAEAINVTEPIIIMENRLSELADQVQATMTLQLIVVSVAIIILLFVISFLLAGFFARRVSAKKEK